VRELQSQATTQQASSPVNVPGDYDIDDDSFEIIPDGHENAGMFFERSPRHISDGEKKYEERAVLAECKINVDGHLTGEEVAMEDTTYTKYTKDGVVKLIQKKGPSSLLEFKGRSFFKLIIRKEVQQQESWAI
jgi:hypothetical protein